LKSPPYQRGDYVNDSADTSVTINPDPNLPPTAVISVKSPVYKGDSVFVDGSGSKDPEGKPLTYVWTTDGATGSITGSSGTISYKAAKDSYTVNLIVIDDKGKQSTATASIKVLDRIPVAIIDANSPVQVGANLPVSGTNSYDPDGSIVSYSWTYGGATGTISGSSGVIKYATAGTYTITLRVIDDDTNVSNLVFKTITVTSAPVVNHNPVARITANPTTVYTGDTVSLSSTGSYDPDGDTLTYSWNTSSGTPATFTTPSGTVSYSTIGAKTVNLTVSDGKGGTDLAQATIMVQKRPGPPVAILNVKPTAVVGEVIPVDGSASYDPDGGPLTYSWTTIGAVGSIGKTSKGNISYSSSGIKTITLTVTDIEGYTSTVSQNVNVSDVSVPLPTATPPPANLSPVAVINMPDTALAGDNVSISGAASHDPDGSIASYSWSVVGAANGITGVSGNTYYNTAGTYTVYLTVVDNSGATGSASKTIVITPPAIQADIKYSDTMKVNRKITLDGSGSVSHPKFPINNYSWSITPVYGAAASDIKYSGSLSGSSAITLDVLFKVAAQYSVTLTVTNSAGQTSTKSIVLTIGPDVAPRADFTTINTITRDYMNANNTVITLNDNSTSTDGDTIVSRVWSYAYDSDNDGDFTDETWKILDNGNNLNPQLTITDVGKYKFELKVTENYGQATISSFITSSDYMTGDTSKKADAEKIVEVINLAPSVDFQLNNDKKVDIYVDIGNTAQNNTSTITSYINSNLLPMLSGNNITANIMTNSSSSGQTGSQAVTFPSSTQQSRSQVVTLPDFATLTGATVDNGNVGYTVTGKTVTVNVSNGTPTTTTPSKTGTASVTSSTNSFSSTYAYSDAQGYTGTLTKSGSPVSTVVSGSYTPSDTKTVTYTDSNSTGSFTTTYNYNSAGYTGALAKSGSMVSSVISGSYTPSDTQTATYTATNSTGSFATTYNYSSGGYTGSLPKSGGVTSTVVSGSYTPSDTKTVTYTDSNSSGSFATTYNYSSGGYSGSLSKSGGVTSTLVSGSYTPADTKTATYTASSSTNSFGYTYSYNDGSYAGTLYVAGSTRQVVVSGSYTPPASSSAQKILTRYKYEDAVYLGGPPFFGSSWGTHTFSYSASCAPSYYWTDTGGYSGTLPYSSESTGSTVDVTPQGTPTVGQKYHLSQTTINDVYNGTITKPAVDTRVYNYQQDYSGSVTKPAVDTRVYSYSQSYSGSATKPASDTRVWSYSQSYSGSVTKPAVDTRVWGYSQDYTGSVTKPATDTRVYNYTQNYSGTVYGPGTNYYSYNVVLNYKYSSLNSLNTIAWQPDSKHYYININDGSMPELQDVNALSTITTNLSTNNIYFVGFGTTSNQTQLQNIVTLNDGKGMFSINNSPNLGTSFTNLANYIVGQMGTQADVISQYALVGSSVTFNPIYSDLEYDPQYDIQWKYTQDPNYFENSLGEIANNGVYVNNPITKFDKPGKYTITVRVRDNPKNDDRFDNYRLWSDDSYTQEVIYVHRKPIANFSVSYGGLDNNGLYKPVVSDTSYDLDHASAAYAGIAQENWCWKLSSSATWTSGPLPAGLTRNTTYLVKLEVQDIEGAWSDPKTVSVDTTVNNIPPTVDCTPTSRTWGNTNVTANITVTDPDGDYQYTRYMWTTSPVKPGGTWTHTDTALSISTTQSADGIWYLHMECYDTQNSFYRVRGPYDIDKTPPTVDCTPQTASDFSITASVNASDVGGSGVSQVQYEWTQSITKPVSGWLATTNTSFTTTQSNAGTWYLHMQVTDKAGNTFYRYRGPFTAVPVSAYDFTITSILDTGWRGYYFDLSKAIDSNGDGKTESYVKKSNTDIKTIQMPINFYSLVKYSNTGVKAGSKVKGYLRVRGNPDSVHFIIRYLQNGVSKAVTIPSSFVSGDKYSFEWTIPQNVDQDTFICFDIAINKDGTSYGNSVWEDNWVTENTSHAVLYVKGTVLNDIEYNQSH
jgi:PKD repeat protein